MKKIFNYIKKHITKKELIIAGIGLGLVLIGLFSWKIYFSKYYILSKYEKSFKEAVEGFYKYHSEYLPKNGSIKTKTLAEVYEEGRLEELKIPGSKDICDLDSWVKVYNDNGKYIYNVYLKCGKYASKTDHKGPTITLNGDDTIYIHIGDEYTELGVKEVKDNKDGKLSIESVTIDNSKVDTKKLGEYKVTYKAKDKLHNVTIVERTVKVVKNLTRIVQDATKDTNGYYIMNSANNFVQFSGMLFQIVKANSDGTIMLISRDNIANLKYNSDKYENSNIDKYLKNVFLKAIHDDSYIVEKEYCVGNISNFNDVEGACSEKITSKVALLSLDDFKNTFKDGRSYICDYNGFVLSNMKDGSMSIVTVGTNDCLEVGQSMNEGEEMLPSIRPVITLKSDLAIVSGAGTVGNPYKLADYEYGKIGTKVNKRIVGEYVNYSGLNYRIQKIDGDNVVLIGADPLFKKLDNGNNEELLKLDVPENYTFNTTDKDNPGYILNNLYIDYINDTNLVQNKYEIPTYDSSKDYDEYETKEVNAKVVLPRTFDLFSGIQIGDDGYAYLYLDKLENKTFYINKIKNTVYSSNPNAFFGYFIKPIITIKGSVVIRDGNGTFNNPYHIGNR